MKLERIVIENFRAFHGEHIIDIAHDDKKSVTVIVAENGIGKSSILEAIHWCLYGDMPDGANIADNIINDFSEELNNEAHANVKIRINDGNETYIISRRLEKENGRSKASIAHQHANENEFTPDEINRDEFVQGFIPKDLKEFFLFNGERVKNLFEANEDRLKESIEHIQGLTFLKKGSEDLDRFYSSLLDKAARQDQMENQQNADQVTIDKLAEDKENAEKNENDVIRKIDEATANITKLDKLISESGQEELKKANNDNQILKKQCGKLREEIEKLYENRKKLIAEHGFMVFGYDYNNQVNQFIEEQRQKHGAFPTDYTESFLKGLLEKEVCICGEKIDTEEKKNALNKALKKGLSNTQEAIITDILAALGAYENSNRNFQRESYQFSYLIQTKETEKKQKEKLIEENNKIIDEIPDLSKKVKNWLKLKKDQEDALKKLLEEKGQLKIAREIATDSWEQAVKASERAYAGSADEQLRDKIDFVKTSREYLANYITNHTSIARNGLLKVLNELADKYSTGGMHFEYSNQESLNPMLLKEGENLQGPLNSGELTMKSIYFACAAIKHNRDRLSENDEWLSKGVNAPFIADAPFSVLGVINLTSAAEMIIEGPEQSVIFINAKDFNAGFEAALNKSGKLGKLYYMQGKRRGEAGSEVANKEITIGNMTVPAFLYNQDEETAVIEKIS